MEQPDTDEKRSQRGGQSRVRRDCQAAARDSAGVAAEGPRNPLHGPARGGRIGQLRQVIDPRGDDQATRGAKIMMAEENVRLPQSPSGQRQHIETVFAGDEAIVSSGQNQEVVRPVRITGSRRRVDRNDAADVTSSIADVGRGPAAARMSHQADAAGVDTGLALEKLDRRFHFRMLGQPALERFQVFSG